MSLSGDTWLKKATEHAGPKGWRSESNYQHGQTRIAVPIKCVCRFDE